MVLCETGTGALNPWGRDEENILCDETDMDAFCTKARQDQFHLAPVHRVFCHHRDNVPRGADSSKRSFTQED